MKYEPKPIDTSRITLPGELTELTELLAENAHDQWAILKLKEGWTYDPVPDNDTKKHPDLVAYGDLPESKKEYDRQMAIETLKAILSLGFKIVKE